VIDSRRASPSYASLWWWRGWGRLFLPRPRRFTELTSCASSSARGVDHGLAVLLGKCAALRVGQNVQRRFGPSIERERAARASSRMVSAHQHREFALEQLSIRNSVARSGETTEGEVQPATVASAVAHCYTGRSWS